MKDILERIELSNPNEGSHDLYCRLLDCAKEITTLRKALVDAAVCMESWGVEINEYIAEKHGIKDDIKEIREAEKPKDDENKRLAELLNTEILEKNSDEINKRKSLEAISESHSKTISELLQINKELSEYKANNEMKALDDCGRYSKLLLLIQFQEKELEELREYKKIEEENKRHVLEKGCSSIEYLAYRFDIKNNEVDA